MAGTMGGEASGAVLFRPVMAGLSVFWMAVGPEFGCGCLGLFRKDSADIGNADGRCCTALAESEIRLWWWPRYVRA